MRNPEADPSGNDGDPTSNDKHDARNGMKPPGNTSNDQPSQDLPEPSVVKNKHQFIWDDSQPADETYVKFGKLMHNVGDLFRRPEHANGLLLASSSALIPPTPIVKGSDFAAIILDRIRVDVISDGKPKGPKIPSYHLNAMLKSEVFLQQFRPIDRVVNSPMFLNDFSLTHPGFNDGGRGHRVFYVGEKPTVADSTEAIDKFLDVMAFAGEADRTNAVGAALTRVLRNHWLGAKPISLLTSTKSHGGKGTIVEFITGVEKVTTVDYQSTNWAMERAFVGTIKTNPEAAVINVDNARLYRGEQYIASAFIERLVTDPNLTLFSTGTGPPMRRQNDLVLALTTNQGNVSTDLMNRGLPIHLDPVGNIEDRNPPIGNPKLEYLPQFKNHIEAELQGMIERWKKAERPLDEDVRHPFKPWAQTIGGILKVSGYKSFLANYTMRKAADDPLRKAIALLGATHPNEWLRPGEWAMRAADLGIGKTLIPAADRDSEKARERGIGKVLSDHRDERFEIETVKDRVVVTLRKQRARFNGGDPETRYRFEEVSRIDLPFDEKPAT